MDSKKYRILSVDLGYSAIKVCYQDQQGVLKYEKFISAVAKFPDKILEEDGDKMFTMNGITYLVGESALKVPKSYLIEIVDYDSMKACYPILLSYLLQRYKNQGLTFDKVVLGLSMAFVDKTDDLLEYLYESLLMDKATNYFIVLPQGLSCKESYRKVGLSLQEKSSEVKMNSYIILDGELYCR